jgi:putative membrane protein
MCALALALVNAIVKPVATVLALPLTIVTMGIFYLVVNALMLELASGLSLELFGSGIEIDSFGAAVMGAIVISIASMIIGPVIGSS